MRVLAAVTAVALLISLPGICSGQEYSDWQVPGGDWEKRYSLGFQLGVPLVAGVDISGQLNERVSAGLGFGFVPDLITLGGQLRVNILEVAPERTVPVVGFGINQYWLEDKKKTAEAVAVHVLMGVQRLFGPEFGIGVYLGYIKTLTDSDEPDIKIWGVNNDMSDLFLGIEGRYYF